VMRVESADVGRPAVTPRDATTTGISSIRSSRTKLLTA
jgi:hypothetical protein